MIYAASVGAKSEAAIAVKHLLAQIDNDHANIPTEIVYGFHSDRGGEFIKEELNQYCLDHGTHKTSAAGYDPHADPAESIVGILERRSRYLLCGARLPTNWWGLSTLAAAQICRDNAGLEAYPQVSFGTHVLIVRDPVPRNSSVPRANAGIVTGPCSSVSDGMWIH